MAQFTGSPANDSIVGTNDDDRLEGQGGSDDLRGGDGDDVLIGGAGADTLRGGVGNDIYRLDDGLDTIIELPGEGFDRAAVAISFALAAGVEIESLGTLNAAATTAIDLTGNEFGQIVFGNAGVNWLSGGDGNDDLRGLDGNDVLIGGAGADLVRGGAGDDVYRIEDRLDTIIELVGEGDDRVAATVSYVLTAGAEVETLGTINASATTAIDLTGNELAQTIFGNDGINILTGGGGNDDLRGLDGNDLLNGGTGADFLRGGTGNDFYRMDDGLDVVVEAIGGGNDRIAASVSYALNAGAEVETIGTINASATTAINLAGNEFGQSIFGNAGVNTLSGGGGNDDLRGLEGNDVLIGGLGSDFVRGGAGDDIYRIDDGLDSIIELPGEGNDRIAASADYVLNSGAEVETIGTINASATTAIDLAGNEFGQAIFGNAGVNTLSGGGGNDDLRGLEGNDALVGGVGADLLRGGAGDDVYRIDDGFDTIVEQSGEGNDRIAASINYILNAGAEVETIGTVNAAATTAIDLTGNEFGQSIFGNAGANTLSGGGGNDDLRAAAGNDILVGGAGADVLRGGTGDDLYRIDDGLDTIFELAGEGTDRATVSLSYTLNAAAEVEIVGTIDPSAMTAINLTGNAFSQTIEGNAGANILNGAGGNDVLRGFAGADRFTLTTAPGPGNIVTIADFEPGIDRIVLAGAAGQPFSALATGGLASRSFAMGAAAADPDDFIIYNSTTGALLYDADGSGAGSAVQFATLQPGLSMTSGAFLVSGAPNNAPIITSGTTATIAENSAASTIVYQTVATDADGDRILYSLGSQDASHFTIDEFGAVRFITPPDYESQNLYSIVVVASDSAGTHADAKTVTINVTDVPDVSPTPVIAETSAPNDSVGQAQSIDRAGLRPSENPNLSDDGLPSATIKGSISTGAPNADIDFYSISLNEGEKLILDIDGTSGDLDTVIRIYNSGGQLVGFIDDSRFIDAGSTEDYAGHTQDAFIGFRPRFGGTYYFSVESWGEGVENGPGSGATTGNYQLNISIAPPATPEQLLSEDIDALIGSAGWPDPNPNLPGTNLTFAFPNSPSDYPAGTVETGNNFEMFNVAQRGATTRILQQIATVADVTFNQLSDPQESTATLRYAMSDEPEVAYAYLPGGGLGGTAWFRNSPIDGRSTPAFDNPVAGGYAWMSIIHETGHALGLKHGHEFPAVSFERDSLEYTVMTYRSHRGQEINGYTNETWGYPTTLMALDVAALQRIYGANFSFNAGSTVYSWSPTTGQSFVNGVGGLMPGGNRVFMTVWDGGGSDTYDFSNYANNLQIDLRPGEWTTTTPVQIANLGESFVAQGNILNAYLYNGDPRSLIENAIAGPGMDTLVANQALNHLTGGMGNDVFRWFTAADVGNGAQADVVTDFVRGQDRLDLSRIDADTTDSTDLSEFTFIGSAAFHNVAGELRYQVDAGGVRVEADLDGNGLADMAIVLNHVTSLATTDFIF